jgi:3'-phosphoadenosine 5'-phosphosulfate sulfotransferase (PAPS reductase)/FAD synthetase
MKQPNSMPLAFWTENDIWEYLRTTRTKYCKIYDMGEKHTGCMFCMFGIQNDSTPNRFQRMRKTHPVQWNYCIYKLGLGEVLDFMNVPYK